MVNTERRGVRSQSKNQCANRKVRGKETCEYFVDFVARQEIPSTKAKTTRGDVPGKPAKKIKSSKEHNLYFVNQRVGGVAEVLHPFDQDGENATQRNKSPEED